MSGRPQIRLRIAAPAGSGKSTLAQMLGEFLDSQGVPVVLPPRGPRRSHETWDKCRDALRRRGTIIVISETDSEVSDVR